ncbi:COMT [Symbiodinium microadriaticum]|nr:COMT [Symbiodinium microadriaticum]
MVEIIQDPTVWIKSAAGASCETTCQARGGCKEDAWPATLEEFQDILDESGLKCVSIQQGGAKYDPSTDGHDLAIIRMDASLHLEALAKAGTAVGTVTPARDRGLGVLPLGMRASKCNRAMKGLTRRLFLLAFPVLLLGIVFAPNPKLLLGDFVGRHVQIARNLAGIFFFFMVLTPETAHPQLAALQHVVQGMRAHTESLDSVSALDRAIDLVDDFGWNHGFLINVGDVKGKILDSAVQHRLDNGPGELKLAVELGTFVGYGTLRLVRMLNHTGAEIITVDPDIFAYTVSSSLYEQAQVRSRITMKTNYSYNVFAELKKQGRKIDFLFVDHVKKLYLPDLKLAVASGVLAKGCVVVGDNIRSPGAPDYKKYLLEGDGSKLFSTEVHRTHVEYWRLFPDEMTVSTYLG